MLSPRLKSDDSALEDKSRAFQRIGLLCLLAITGGLLLLWMREGKTGVRAKAEPIISEGRAVLAVVGDGRVVPRKPSLRSWFGSTPHIDGVLSPGEWADAEEIRGVGNWTAEFLPVTDSADLSLRGWVKHDAEWLYFAFDITDDVLYGIDTERWLPKENPKAHELSRDGFPWFGDEM